MIVVVNIEDVGVRDSQRDALSPGSSKTVLAQTETTDGKTYPPESERRRRVVGRCLLSLLQVQKAFHEYL